MEKNKKIKSFTIIEILITLTIIFIFSVIGIANYNQYNEQIKIKNEAKKFIDVFELTKKQALSSYLYDKNCQDFRGYQISINSTGNQYKIYFICNTNYINIATYDLNKNLSFIIGNNSNFYFPATGANINITNNNIRIKNSTINQCLDISITNNAIINFNESLFSC